MQIKIMYTVIIEVRSMWLAGRHAHNCSLTRQSPAGLPVIARPLDVAGYYTKQQNIPYYTLNNSLFNINYEYGGCCNIAYKNILSTKYDEKFKHKLYNITTTKFELMKIDLHPTSH